MDAATIVLPVHNAERALRPLVIRILEVATAPARRLTVAILDDGSTDETYEAACELARDFPQVRVFRQPHRCGLGPLLDQVRRRLQVDEVILHDGVGPIDVDELASLLAGESGDPKPPSIRLEGRGSRRFAAVTALNARMEVEHRAVSSFQRLQLGETGRPRRQTVPLANLPLNPLAGELPISLP